MKTSGLKRIHRSRLRIVIAIKMIRAKRSVVQVRRWLIRAKQDLELVPAIYGSGAKSDEVRR
jgi:hypothetical protein